MKTFKRVLGVTTLVAALLISACGRPSAEPANNSPDGEATHGGQKYTIRIAHLLKEEQAGHLALENFKRNVKERSNGQIEIQLFPNGSLYGSDREAIEAVQLGNIEMTATALAPIASFNPKLMVFDLPYLY